MTNTNQHQPMKTNTTTTSNRPLFEMGRVGATPGALALVADPLEFVPILHRHQSGDWIDTGTDAEPGEFSDADLNNLAIINGGRIFTVADLPAGRVWIITEAKGEDGRRASTCILTPEEY